MKRRWYRIVGVVVGLLLLGGGSVLAQGPQDEPLCCGGPRWRDPRFIEVAAQELGMEREALMERLCDGELLGDIAAEQGKTLHDLTEAFLAAQDEALTEAVDQGYFAQERATCRLQQLRQRVERCLAGLGWHRFPWRQVGLETVAELLGMTEEELHDELREGKTIPGLAERQGVELAIVSQALQEAREEALAQAVEEGRITQEQADRVRQHSQRRTELCLMWPGPGPCTGCFAPCREQLSPGSVPPLQPRLRRIPPRR